MLNWVIEWLILQYRRTVLHFLAAKLIQGSDKNVVEFRLHILDLMNFYIRFLSSNADNHLSSCNSLWTTQ